MIPSNDEIEDPSLNEHVDPFVLEKLKSFHVVIRGEHGGGGLVESILQSRFQETGKDLAAAINNSLDKLMFVPGLPSADIVIEMDDAKRVSLKYGFYIQFSDGDVTTEYFLKDPSKELIHAYAALVEEAEEFFWMDIP